MGTSLVALPRIVFSAPDRITGDDSPLGHTVDTRRTCRSAVTTATVGYTFAGSRRTCRSAVTTATVDYKFAGGRRTCR
ncbi:MAG TPA: hypothetical protein P5193_07650 [Microthrixaceae bacterium]|nr:hypothetical protein [Microthrixaceae bacterium]HNG24062.1 hypothetical protein [Microthrixaceae bacterium]HRW41407.1 hypothetical protein [Microthrixaceae bacterium]